MSPDEARERAAELARKISAHHAECRTCAAGGRRLTVTVAGRLRLRVRCRAERKLFAELAAAQEAGWPGQAA